MQELRFLRSACRLMLIDIYMKFREDSLNGFQVIERTSVWQTDRCLGDNSMSPDPKGERHNNGIMKTLKSVVAKSAGLSDRTGIFFILSFKNF